MTARHLSARTAALALAACALAACAGEADMTDTAAVVAAVPMDTGMNMPAAGMAADGMSLSSPETLAQLDSVVAAAEGGLTNTPPAVAVPLIRSIEQKLRAANSPTLTEIATNLDSLANALQGGGGDISAILSRLGTLTNAAANDAGPAQATVARIGDALSSAARNLRN